MRITIRFISNYIKILARMPVYQVRFAPILHRKVYNADGVYIC